MKKILTIFLIFNYSFVKSQIIDFKIRVEDERYILYDNIKLDEIICKGDSIIGYSKDTGNFYSSFDKGITFNSVNTSSIGKNNDFVSNQSYDYGKSILFLRGNDIILYLKSKYYISKDWINFSAINHNTKSDFPLIIQQLQSQDENYHLINNIILEDKIIASFSSAYGTKYRIFYSSDLKNWNEIKKPNNLNMMGTGIKFYKNVLYLFTWDKNNNNELHTSSDFGINWEKVNEFNFNYSEGLDSYSLMNVIFFNDKFFYQNIYKPYIYDLKDRTTQPLKLNDNYIGYPKTKDDFLYFTNNNLILTYKDSLINFNINNLEFKNPKSISDIYITDKFVIINGSKLIPNKTFTSDESLKLSKRNEESKFVKINDKSLNNTSDLSITNNKSEFANSKNIKVNGKNDLVKEGLKGSVKSIETTIYNSKTNKNIFTSKRFFTEFGKISSISSNSDFSDKIEDFEMNYYPEEFNDELLVVLPFCRTKNSIHVGNKKEYGFGGSMNLKFEYDHEGKLISVWNIKFIYDNNGNLIEKKFINQTQSGYSPTIDGWAINNIKYKWQDGKLMSKYAYNDKGKMYSEFYDIKYEKNQQIIRVFKENDKTEYFYRIEFDNNGKIISKSKEVVYNNYSAFEPKKRKLSTRKFKYNGNYLINVTCEDYEYDNSYYLSSKMIKMNMNPNEGIITKTKRSEFKIIRDNHGNILYIDADNYGRNQFSHDTEWSYEYDEYGNWIRRIEYEIPSGNNKNKIKMYDIDRKIFYY